MDIKEAISARHTVRKYTDRSIPQEIAVQLTERIQENNLRHHLNMKLVQGNSEAFGAIIKLVLAKGVDNYIILAGPDREDLEEELGYCGADVMLFAQTLGLNTWWVGGTFSQKGVQKNIALDENERIIGVIVVGYGETQGVPHKSKTAGDISSYQGNAPEWFVNGVEAVLLAPTALNKQAFQIKGEGDKVAMACDNGAFSGVDLGIGKYHFEIGAGKENFIWVK